MNILGIRIEGLVDFYTAVNSASEISAKSIDIECDNATLGSYS